MPTLDEVESIRADCFADDVAVPPAAQSWTRQRLIDYFESAGQSENLSPPPATSSAPSAAAPRASGEKILDDGTVVLAAPLLYQVVYSAVRVRAAPATTANDLGMLRKGTVISVDAVRSDWVRIAAPDGFALAANDATRVGDFNADKHSGGWMLADGRVMKLGWLLKPHTIEVSQPLAHISLRVQTRIVSDLHTCRALSFARFPACALS